MPTLKRDGSYTINIPEDNPFFPYYEVQLTYDGKDGEQVVHGSG